MKRTTFMFFMLLTSLCGFSQGLPLEGFEGTWPPAGWEVFNIGGPGFTWEQSVTEDPTQPFYEGQHAAYLQRENVQTGTSEDWLVTPRFVVPASPQLRFYSRLAFEGNQGSTYKIMMCTTGDPSNPANYSEIQTWTESQLNPDNLVYTLIRVSLPATAVPGQQVNLAFVMLGDNDDSWLIDNVEVVQECFKPTELEVGSLTQTSASLSWATPGNSTSWEIEVVPQGGTPTRMGVVYSGTLPYVVNNLTEETCYQYYVRAKCSLTNNSDWAGPYNFCTVAPGQICSSAIPVTTLPFSVTGNTSDYGDDFDGIPGTTCGTETWEEYLNGDEVAYVYTAPATGVISIDLSNAAGSSGVFVYNDCEDVGVECAAAGITGGGESASIEEFSVVEGQDYFIIISSWFEQSIPYTLTIQQVNCGKPQEVTTSGATTTGINISWTEAGTATSWQYAIQAPGAGIPAGNGTTIATTSTTVNTLNPSTGYELYVRADCGNGTFSAWSGPVRFNTLCEALNLPFSEGFNTNSTTEFCWTVLDANDDGDTWNLNDENGPFEGDQEAVLYTDGSQGDNDDWLISPTINITGTPKRLKYHFRVESENEPNEFEVKLSTTGLDPEDFTVQLVPLTTYTDNMYAEVIVNLVDGSNTPYTGPVNIAWHVPQSEIDGWRIHIDNVIIEDIPSCPDPLALRASNATATTTVLSWRAGYLETAWDIVVQAPGAGEPTGEGTPVPGTQPTYTARDLQPATNYEYYVRANCSADDKSEWAGPFKFMTTQVPAALDYTQDFETPVTGFSLSNGDEENVWVVGNAVNNGGGGSLYITNDGGTTNSYDLGEQSTVHAFRDIQMPAVIDQVVVSFDWRNVGEPGFGTPYDYLTVWAVPTSFVPVPGEAITANDGVLLSPVLAGSNTFSTGNYVFNASDYAGDIVRFVFQWTNDSSGGTQPPAAVDNVRIAVITCPAPTNLAATVGSITRNEATITWTGPTSVTPVFEYYLSTSNTAPTASTVPTGTSDTASKTLENLTESTIYYIWVRSNCGTENGNSFWTGPLEFHTMCGPFTVPYYEGFNSSSTSQFCWTVLDVDNDNTTWDLDYEYNAYEGDESAGFFNTESTHDDWLISPTIILTGNERLKFHYKTGYEGDTGEFEVLLSTTGTAPVSFTNTIVPLATYNNGDDIEVITNINSFTGPVNFAFHVPAGSASGYMIYIDNVIVEAIPSCPDPTNIEVSCLSTEGGFFTWTAGSTETEWEVAVLPAGGQFPAAGTTVTEANYFTDALTANSDYTFYVRAICPDGTSVGAWKTLNFTTPTTSVVEANGFCSSDNPDQSILFDNTFDINGEDNGSLGPIACLYSSPNPVWYYLQVDQSGVLNFELIQNTEFDEAGEPIGDGLDVDFVAYGPFTSLAQGCSEIIIEQCDGCPNNTQDPDYYPVGNIVDCSYDGAYIENFTIPNAVAGEIYAVLITNFNGAQGQIKLQMLETSTGTTNCNIIYNVDLGNDQILCGADSTTITAEVTTPGNSLPPTYQWFRDDVLIQNPVIVSTNEDGQTIEVNEPGSHIYKVVITVENSANTEPITDSVTIVLGPEVNATAPQVYAVCDDAANDGFASFNLTSLNSQVLGNLNSNDYTVSYFSTEANATANTSPITDVEAYINTDDDEQTIYVRVNSIAVPTCFDIVTAQLVVKPLPVTAVNPTYTACEGQTITITGTPDNYNAADATYAWFLDSNPIAGATSATLTATASGRYTLETTLNGCTGSVETQVIMTPLPAFSLGGPYEVCVAQTVAISVDGTNFDENNATYAWTFEGQPLSNTSSSIQATGFGLYEVTVTVNNCESTGSIAVTKDTRTLAVQFSEGCEDNVYKVEAIDVEGNFDAGTAQFAWSGPQGFTSTDAEIIPPAEGDYTVTVTTAEGCTGTQLYKVLSTYCFIQKGISPNGDDKNDSFDLSALNVKHLSIFNRYGQEVFTYGNYTSQWYGQNKNGDELPTGTYFYSIERENGESKTGWVYINREEN